MKFQPRFAILTLALALCSVPCRSQMRGDNSNFGVAVKASTLGVGLEGGMALAPKLNLRGGFNAFSYSGSAMQDGVFYSGNMSFRSGEASLDWFPFAGAFHVSPGFLFYNGNKVTANSSVAGGSTFTLNGVSYMSSTNNPVKGTGSMTFNKVAPSLKIGFGNLVPRNGHRWSFLAEAGIAYVGYPNVALTMGGTACDISGANCVNAATDPNVQKNLYYEQYKIGNSLQLVRFYPLMSLGVGYNF